MRFLQRHFVTLCNRTVWEWVTNMFLSGDVLFCFVGGILGLYWLAMAADTTASSYWLNWRVLLCALILLAPIVLAAVLIWKYEGKRRRQRESQRELPGTLFQDEAWTTCFKRIHPLWLLAFRVFSFVAMLTLLISNVVRDGAGIFYFYTQWVLIIILPSHISESLKWMKKI